MNGETTPTRQSLHPGVGLAWRDDRRYLVAVATRMLGRPADAEDVVQEAFGRLLGTDVGEIRDVRGWLTVVVRRLCLNRLRSAYARRESVSEAGSSDASPPAGIGVDPGDRITLDDQVRLALAMVLDRLTPAERTAFVLHDVFGLAFADVGEIVGRSASACRQLASRARRAFREGESSGAARAGAAGVVTDDGDVVAERFIAACAGGDLDALVAVLDPDVAGETTRAGGRVVGHAEGAHDVAAGALRFLGPSASASLVPVPFDGAAGVVAITGGRVAAVIRLDTADGRIHHLHAFLPRPPRRPRSGDAPPAEP